MAKEFITINETLAYVTAEDKVNTDPRYLVAGSKNVLIDRERKVVTRRGLNRLGSGSATANPIKTQETWLTSTGREWMLRFYDDEFEVYIGTIDGVDVNDWKRVMNGLTATEIQRVALNIWKDSETLDVSLFVNGNANLYEWNGAVAVVSSVTANTITKQGTTTFGQNRFFANANRTLINVRTGTEFTYTGGLGTTTLTGVSGSPVADGMIAGDILVQKVVTHTNEPASSRNNHTIGVADNHVLIGSNDDSEVYMTANDDFTDTTFSSPRIAGEGGLFTLDGPSRGFGKLGDKIILFSGDNSIFRAIFREITVSTTLAEVIDVKKIDIGTLQGSISPDTIIQLGNAVMYLSAEPAWRYIQDPEELGGLDPKTLSNPIKPDFDSEDWSNAHVLWYKNAAYLSAPTNGRLYILEFVEDADGRLRRFWQPPQILPVRTLSELGGKIYGGSNAVQETLELFATDTYSDMVSGGTHGNPDDKTPIHYLAAYSYNTYDRRARLKTFDEYYVEGEIRENSNITQTFRYDFGGSTSEVERTINGSDEDITETTLQSESLGQHSLGQNPIGGALEAPDDAALFGVVFELAREDFRKIQVVFESNDIDYYWSIFSHGPNVELSRRREVNIKK